jgi:hypothetical protein
MSSILLPDMLVFLSCSFALVILPQPHSDCIWGQSDTGEKTESQRGGEKKTAQSVSPALEAHLRK